MADPRVGIGSGGRTPSPRETDGQGFGPPVCCSSRATSKARAAPRLCPKNTNGRSSSGSITRPRPARGSPAVGKASREGDPPGQGAGWHIVEPGGKLSDPWPIGGCSTSSVVKAEHAQRAVPGAAGSASPTSATVPPSMSEGLAPVKRGLAIPSSDVTIYLLEHSRPTGPRERWTHLNVADLALPTQEYSVRLPAGS